MSWHGFVIAGLLAFLSFSVSAANAQVGTNRDPFARVGVSIPAQQEVKPVAKPSPARKPVYRRPVPKVEAPITYNEKPFAVWLAEFQAEALAKGVPQSVLDSAFRGIAPNDTVVKLDRKQPENKISWTQYRTNSLNARRIAKGRALMAEHKDLLAAISAKYKVPAEVIVALWGTETEFGANKGNFSLIQSLTTLAYEGRRADFFRAELHNALQIMEDERVMGSAITGSWAGAMGHCQFMPSSYLKYAVDWNGDGHRDIWNSVPDALASIANYLHQSGWNNDVNIATAVTLPAGMVLVPDSLYAAKPLQHWRDAGVATRDGKQLDGNPRTTTYLMNPGTPEEGAYIVTDNYHVLLKWNRSRYFASAVSQLADAVKQ